MSGNLIGWTLALAILSPIAYYMLIRRSIRIDLDGIRIYSGLIQGRYITFRKIKSLQLERREDAESKVYHRLFVEVGENRICIGDESDFSLLKTALEAKCKVVKEDAEMAAKLGIGEAEYQKYPEPIGRKYYCEWGSPEQQ